MRTTFTIENGTTITSAIRPKEEPHALREGQRVELSGPFETPYGTVSSGGTGTIEHVDEASGLVKIVLENPHGLLWPWHDILVISPYETEDLSVLIRLLADH